MPANAPLNFTPLRHSLAGWLQVREGSWRVAPLPADLQDRRVEITGPTDCKMVINALNRCGGWDDVCIGLAL